MTYSRKRKFSEYECKFLKLKGARYKLILESGKRWCRYSYFVLKAMKNILSLTSLSGSSSDLWLSVFNDQELPFLRTPIFRKISLVYSEGYMHWKDWCWSWNSNTLATWCEELTHLKRPWCWERLRTGGEGDNRGWDGWMASPTQWTQVWVNSRSWWWTRDAWRAAVHGVTKSRTWLSDWTDYVNPL